MDETKKKYAEMMMHYAIDIICIAGNEEQLSLFVQQQHLSPHLKQLRDSIETGFFNK